MPGERPRRAPPPTMTGDLQPCQAARGLGRPLQPPIEDHSPGSRTTQGSREAAGRAQAREPPEAQPRQAREVEATALLLSTQAPPRRSGPQAPEWVVGGAGRSPTRLCSLSITRSRAKPTLDATPEGSPCEATQDPEAEGPRGPQTGAHPRPSLLGAKALPAPKGRNSQRCFPEAPSSLTSTDYTSPKATPGPLPLRVPQSSRASPHGPASYPEFQARGANAWPPAAANDFPGADFGVPPPEPEPFSEGSRPSSPQRGSFQFPFPAQGPHGAGPKPFPADTAGQDYAGRGLVLAFHQPTGTWQEAGVGIGAAYPLPAGPAAPTLPCYPSQPGGLDDPRDPGGALSPTGAAHLAPSPLPDSLHKSLTTVLPDGAPSAHDGMGSPRGPPNPLSQRHFPGQAYGANGVGASPEPVDTELTTPGPPPTRLPQLWDPTAAPYPTAAVGPPDATGTAFLKGQPGPGQGLCLPQSSPVPWPQALPTPGPSPHRMEILSQLPFPRGTPEWQGDSHGGLSAACQAALPAEALGVRGGSPGLFPYSGPSDPGAQPLFFGGAQPQASPRGAPGLPPPRVVGASPSESPLPSPATTTAGSSSCSSLSPLSSSPANPSPEDGQLPGPLGPSAFFHPAPRPQETGSAFPSPEPPHALPTHYQLEPAKAFAFPTDGRGAEGPRAGEELLQGFPREPPPYPSHHFSLSSASLDQLDVLLTCRQCDRNYGSLAAFLAHRHFCRPARAGDGPQQPPGPPAPTTAPKAPTHAHTGPLSHSQTVPFLLARDDPLRTSYLPSLANPFPLPASDLDMEDEAKLDSLITEALNGMEDQSDNPEIDSSFIDVFADEEPSGPRGPGAGLPTHNRPGVAPEHSAQDLLPAKADTPEPRAPCPADGSCPPGNRPKTRSLGLAPVKADAASPVRPRRGKQFKLLHRELDADSGPKGPCLRPRKRGCGTERPPPCPRGLRTQAQGHTAPDGQARRASSLATETRSSRRLRLPPKKDPRKRRVRGGAWSKELIHKIVRQKNKLHRRQAQHGLCPRGPPLPPLPPRALPSTRGGRLAECTSESEEEYPRTRGPGSRGPSHHGHQQWHQCRKREDHSPQGPRKGLRHEASEDRGSLAPMGPCSPPGGAAAGGTTVGLRCQHADGPTASPKHPPQVPANSKSPEESHPPLDFPQKAQEPAKAEESASKLREGSVSAAISVGESARPPAPEPTQRGRPNTDRPQPPGGRAPMLAGQSTPAPGPREDCPADQPGEALRPGATYPEPRILLAKNAEGGCDPAHSDRDPEGVPPASSSAPSELLLGPRDLEGCYPGSLCSEPSAPHVQRASGSRLLQDSMDALEPKPLKHSPDAADADLGNVPSPLTLESTSLFAGLPEDGFDRSLCHGQSTDVDTHTPLAQANSPPEKPLIDPLYSSFLLLAEESPVLPSQFPDPSGGKSLGKKCPHEPLAPPSSPHVPGKGSECSLSSLSEDELEIKRLVTELESQLQRKEGTERAPGEPGAVAPAGSVGPTPGPEPASPHQDTVSTADLTGLGESNGREEGMETAVASTEGALGSVQGEWPCPALCHPGKAVSPPSTHKEPDSGAPLSPPGSSISFQAEKARVSETEDGRDPSGQLLRVAQHSAKCSPKQELLFLKNNETVRTQGTEDTPRWLPCGQSRECSPEPPKAEGCCRGSPAWGARGNPNPIARLASDLAIQGDGGLPPGARHSVTSEGHSEGRAGGSEEAGFLPLTAGPGFEGKGAAPAGVSRPAALLGGEPRDPPTPSPAWAPEASPSRRPQTLASLCSQPLQVLGPSMQGSAGALLAAACGPPHRGPPGPGGRSAESGPPECKQVTSVPAATGPQLGPEADGQLGLSGQAKEPEDCGEARRLQSANWRNPADPDKLARLSAHPGKSLARPAGGSPELQGSQATVGLWEQTQPTPGPAPSGGALSLPAPMVALTQKAPEDRAPEVSSPGLGPQLLFSRERPAPHSGGLGTRDPTSTVRTTPTPCSLEHLAQAQPQGLLPASASCVQGLPSHSARGQGEGPSCVQAPTGAGTRGDLAALPFLTTSHGGPQEIPPGCPLLRASIPQDPPHFQPGLGAASTHTYKCYGPKDSTLRTLEDPRREGLGRPPACHTLPPPGGAISPRVVTQAAGPSSIPAEDGTEVVRGLLLRGATYPDPSSVSEGPSSEPPSNTPLLGHGEGESTSAVPTDTTSPGATGPDLHACLGGETGAGKEGEGDPETLGARHPGTRKVPRGGTSGPVTTPPPTGLCEAQDSTSSSTARDLRSDSPQNQTSVLRQTPQKDPKQRPRGFKKKPEPTATGHQKSPPPARPGPPVTCEICSAHFRSRPGLNRHKARKHQPGQTAASQRRPPVTPARHAAEPTAHTGRGPRKRSHRGPGGDRPSVPLRSPGHTPGPSPVQGSTVPEDTLGPETLEEARSPGEPRTSGCPLNQGLVRQGHSTRASAPKPRRPDLPEVGQPPPKQTENRDSRRQTAECTGSPGSPEGKPSEDVGKPRAREDSSAPASADPGLAGRGSSPPVAKPLAPLSSCLLPEGEREASVGQMPGSATLGPEVLKDTADTGLGVLCAEVAPKSPRNQRLHRGRAQGPTDGVLPGELPVGRKGASARWSRGRRELGAAGLCREAARAAGSRPAEDSRGAPGSSGKGTAEGSLDAPEASDSVGSNSISGRPRGLPGARGEGQGPLGTAPEAHGPGLGDPPSLLDDEVSFSELFPLDGRFARKKNPRVYGKRCKRPKRPPPTEPLGEGRGLLCPTHLPTDLSDTGSLCLSLQDPWDDEALVLPEPFLLDGLLGGKAPGLDPWAPSLSLWAPEPDREADPGEEAPSCCAEEAGSEAIPELHLVPAAWRGLDLRAPTNETALGEASPEPPDLEREHYDSGPPGSASLLPLHTKDFEMLSAKLEMQDLCFLGPCEDLAGLLSASLLDFKAAASSQGPASERTEGAAGAAQAGGRELAPRGRRASYKCRVCFQRFRGLGELDLHRLAHSPCPPPTCYLCVERRFCSRERLREHLQQRHLQGRAGPWACGMCLQEVADVWMFNQHLREHAARFARRGQAQPSSGGLPGGPEPESTHTPSLDSTLAPGRPHRGRHTVDRTGGSAREMSEGEREAKRDAARDPAKPQAQAGSLSTDRAKSRRGLPSGSATGSAKLCPSLAPDPWPQGEPLLPAGSAPAACRDPSRDCHHCGKHFPKPFKLQRHLVVHSPRRVYLCPRCPGVYPEPQELRAHLGGAHGVREERELPHTPLYACELCANVMHVIRRSFICSSCNYTFAKKEQFDRHMDKHLRGGQQPFALRSVRRPGTPRQKALALEGVLPNKRRKLALPSSPATPGVAAVGPLPLGSPTLSKGSPPGLPHLCPEAAPSTSEGWADPAGPSVGQDELPPRSQELPPPALSPFPTASASGKGDQRLDPTLERPEDEAQPSKQQAPPEEKRAPPPFSGRHRSLGARSMRASDCSPGDPSQLQKERPESTPHMAPERDTRGPSLKGGATKPLKHRTAASTPSKAPKLPVQPRKAVGVESPAPRELTQSTEDRVKPTSPKAKPRTSSQGSRGPGPGIQTGGGSQPQPASGRLQSETATTPAGPIRPGPNPTSDKPPSRTQARGCTKGPREAGDQGSRGLPGPREMDENREKRRRGQATELTPHEVVGNLGRAPPAPNKPPRTPRKQATPSRVLPAKPRPSSQDGKMRSQPSQQPEGHSRAHRRGALGRYSPQARPLLKSPKRGRAVDGAEATELRDHRTAESQSNLLSQLFGQRLTSFKIPLKKCTSE